MNLVTFISTTALTGTQVAIGIKMRYFTEIEKEREMMKKYSGLISIYNEIINEEKEVV